MSTDRPSSNGYEHILTQCDGPAFIITINRPEKNNALNGKLRREICDAMESVKTDPDVRAIILWGGTKLFAAGADVNELLALRPLKAYRGMSPSVPDLFGDVISRMPQPVIAAVAGLALGGGNELAMACDLRIAADNAVFGQPEVSIGMIPGGGATWRLARLVGMTKAKEMILTGEFIRAPEALALGLINRVVPADQLLNEAKSMATSIANQAPQAVHLAKLMLDHGQDTNRAAGLAMESLAFAGAFTTHDMREGVAAFQQKRRPNYTNT